MTTSSTTDKARAAQIMAALEDGRKSLAELASILGCSENSVRKAMQHTALLDRLYAMSAPGEPTRYERKADQK